MTLHKPLRSYSLVVINSSLSIFISLFDKFDYLPIITCLIPDDRRVTAHATTARISSTLASQNT